MISVPMINLCYVDAVVVLVRADPLDPNDLLLEIDGHDKAIVVVLDVEHDLSAVITLAER